MHSMFKAIPVHQRRLLYLVVAIAVLRLLTLGLYPLFDATEARYAEIARKMVELNDWITPWYDYGVPFWGKPPLSFWLSALSIKLLGVSEFAARLPHYLIGLLVLGLICGWLAQRSREEAVYAVSILAASMLFFVSAGAVMTDMSLTLGCVLMLRGFWQGLHATAEIKSRERWLLFLGAAVGLLAKGPVALVIAGFPMVVWMLTSSDIKTVFRAFPWLRGVLLTLILVLPWYLLAELRTPGFLNYFIMGEHWHRFVTPGWHGDQYGHAHHYAHGTIWVFMLLALLPWSVLIPLSFLWWEKKAANDYVEAPNKKWRWFLLLAGLTPCLFFTVSANILWTYGLPGLPLLAMLGASYLVADADSIKSSKVLMAGVMMTMLGWIAYLGNMELQNMDEVSTTKGLVADFEHRKNAGDSLLFYITRPYSAEFYSTGKAEKVRNQTDLGLLIKKKKAYVAMPHEQYQLLATSIKNELKLVNHHGRFDLYIAQPEHLAEEMPIAKKLN